jgi:hypothetical protein
VRHGDERRHAELLLRPVQKILGVRDAVRRESPQMIGKRRHQRADLRHAGQDACELVVRANRFGSIVVLRHLPGAGHVGRDVSSRICFEQRETPGRRSQALW